MHLAPNCSGFLFERLILKDSSIIIIIDLQKHTPTHKQKCEKKRKKDEEQTRKTEINIAKLWKKKYDNVDSVLLLAPLTVYYSAKFLFYTVRVSV